MKSKPGNSFGMVKGSGNAAGNSMGHSIRKRDVVSYALLPKILPRFGNLFFTGFHFFAFFMAQVYRGVRLLPADHPSLNPANIGQFGIRDVIGSAARHLVWRRENIDQIIVFIAILLGLFLIMLQVVTFIVAIAVPGASAGAIPTPSAGFSAFFTQPFSGSQDLAFILLDRVFGVKGIFDSCVSTGTPCYGVSSDTLKFDTDNTVYVPPTFPWPYHEGLHTLFEFYSTGLLLVAVFILIYFVIVIVAETAQTGTPFGKRFNTVWAPIRLVVAFGLLIPISNGLNSAQYITLYAAKWGSNFATNGWVLFNDSMADGAEIQASNMAQGLDLAVKPKEPDIAGLLQFIVLAHSCKIFSETIMHDPGSTLATTPAAGAAAGAPTCGDDGKGAHVEAYLVKAGFEADKSAELLMGQSYDNATDFSEHSDIKIRFGTKSCSKDYAMAGNIEPTCGEITLPINSLTETGAKSIQEGYYKLIQYLWGGYSEGENGTYRNNGTLIAAGGLKDERPEVKACSTDYYDDVLACSGDCDSTIRKYALSYFQNGVGGPGKGVCEAFMKDSDPDNYNNYSYLPMPPDNWFGAAVTNYMYGSEGKEETSDIDTDVDVDSAYDGSSGSKPYILRNILKKAVRDLKQAVDDGKYNISEDNLQRGWAAAGIWYNKIAEMDGALIGAAWDLPAPNRYPEIMMDVLTEKKQSNVSVSAKDQFVPSVTGADIKLPMGANGNRYAQTMSDVWQLSDQSRQVQSTGNAMSDFINLIFGTQGLFDLRYQQNNRAHPLAMLVGVGKGLIEASIRNLGLGLGSGLLGVVASLAVGGTATPELTQAFSSMLFSIATLTLTAGFILFYVIPFLPFLYFFFAVGNWLKGVFEAMVGVPLWALAHLRIDGNGLPGEAAINGYFMIFEIFLRPLLIVFGFLASITIFSAMATVLHEIFEVAVSNLTGAGTGAGASKAIDNFFYTVMYAVIMYIMALSSFKLIDLIPNQIMRWMGTGVSTFSDMQSNAADQLTNMTAIAGQQVVSGITSGLQGGLGAASKFGAGMNQAIMRQGK